MYMTLHFIYSTLELNLNGYAHVHHMEFETRNFADKRFANSKKSRDHGCDVSCLGIEFSPSTSNLFEAKMF